MIEQKVKPPAQNEWAAPIVFAPKNDGTLRFCVGYRNLIASTKRDLYPVLAAEEFIDSPSKATVCSSSDAITGHRQGKTDEINCDKIDFTLHHSIYRFFNATWNAK